MRAIVKVFVSGILGLAWLLVPVGYVHALDNTASCAKEGFILCKDGACGRRNCACDGKTLKPGEDCKKWSGGKLYIYYCDGCSGKMLQVITRQPPRQVAPSPGGTLQK
jgi:hypothetical protein